MAAPTNDSPDRILREIELAESTILDLDDFEDLQDGLGDLPDLKEFLASSGIAAKGVWELRSELFRRALNLAEDNPGLPKAPSLSDDLVDDLLVELTSWCEKASRIWKARLDPYRASRHASSRRSQSKSSDALNRQPAPPTLDDGVWLGAAEFAEKTGVNREQLRKRLERLRAKNHDCYREIADGERKPREPKFVYQYKFVRPIVDRMKASGETSA